MKRRAREMPVFQFDCTHCRYLTKKYNAWRKHLLEESHQIQGRERSKKWTAKDFKKAVVVFGLFSVKKSDVLKHFGDLAFVADYVFWNERPDFCIIQFLTMKFRENVMSSKQSINGLKLFLRPREQITEEEWVSICPFLSITVKMEVDLGESTSPDPFIDSSDEENGTLDEENIPVVSTVPNNQNHLNRSSSQSGSVSDEENEIRSCESEDNISLSSLKEDNPVHIRVREDLFESLTPKNFVSTENGMDIEKDEWNDTERLWNEQLEELYNKNLMPPSDWELRNRAKEHLEQLLKLKYPNCVLIPFGSGSTAISSGKEVFCMYLDVFGYTKKTTSGDVFQMDMQRDEIKKLKSSVVFELLKGSNKYKMCSRIDTIDEESQEIELKFLEVKCRIALTAFIPAQGCRIVKFLCTLDHRVRPMLIVLRHWSVQHKFVVGNWGSIQEKEDHFHPAMFQWLVIFYLSHRGIIPSINLLQARSSVAIMHCGTNVGFCHDLNAIQWRGKKDYETDPVTGNPSAKCILTLAQEMFEFFGNIELNRNIISPNSGALIPIEALKFHSDYIHPFRSRQDWISSQKFPTHKNSHVCIQHPLKLCINMTECVIKSNAVRFTNSCRITSRRLQLLWNRGAGNDNAVEALNSDVPAILSSEPISSTHVHVSLQKINVVPDIPVAAEDQSVTRRKPGKKIKPFAIQLYISSEFRDKAATVKEPKMKEAIEDNLSSVWLTFLQDFNSFVWPICFGVKIIPFIPLPDSINNTDDRERKNTKLLGLPFKGILVKPKSSYWGQNKRLKDAFLNDCFKLLKYARTATIPDLPDNQDDLIEDSFTFECQLLFSISEKAKRSSRRGQARFEFTSVRGSGDLFAKGKKVLTQMYTELWQIYSIDRLLSSRQVQLN